MSRYDCRERAFLNVVNALSNAYSIYHETGGTQKAQPGIVICHWSFVTGHLSLVICHWSFVTGHLSLVICHWSFAACTKADAWRK